MTVSLDPRGYEVIPIAAPTAAEKAQHYLWRFWNELPKDGHLTIFDRSWYGRVLVERVEGFCRTEDWRRAYQEINEFERSLADHGTVVCKFWLHISPEEQLRRFQLREVTPAKFHKITEEDWRNRAKWPQYLEAVNDMLRQTSTSHAPWTIVEANDKLWARVKVIRTVVAAIENALDDKG
jgi:polyphosphate kinase 2 (PPK2 family)